MFKYNETLKHLPVNAILHLCVAIKKRERFSVCGERETELMVKLDTNKSLARLH